MSWSFLAKQTFVRMRALESQSRVTREGCRHPPLSIHRTSSKQVYITLSTTQYNGNIKINSLKQSHEITEF